MEYETNEPKHIKVRGARVHNLKNIDVDVPLHKIVGIAGVSGSGKSSLALGVLYAEGSRRYLESLSTYTRRRMTGAAKAQVDEVLYVPAALALHQRPGIPGIRSTFGTGTELLNSLRLMYSRLASHRCPNGHYVPPTLKVAAEQEILCPECGAKVHAPSAEELAFNSQGACPKCGGTGSVRTVDLDSLVPDDSLSIDEGAVAPWNSLMWSLMTDVCREMGVRTDVPFRELTDREKEIVYHGPAEKKHIFYKAKKTNQAGELDFTYFNAVYTVENALAKVKDEKGMKRVEKFLKEDICPECGGSRLSDAARAPRLRGIGLAQACQMPLKELVDWVAGVPDSLPEEMRPMAESICESFQTVAKRLMDLGLSYLSLDRAAASLSTGERQRMQLARAVRNRTTGVLYVLDEPSIGLHPSNIVGLNAVMHDLIADGNSIILVDHDTQILSEADWLIEMGPEAGAGGGYVITQGTIPEVIAKKESMIGPFLAQTADMRIRKPIARQACGRKNVCLHLTALAVSLGLIGELVNALLTGAGNSLIGRNDDTFNACQVIQRLQCHNHNNGRAVRVGNNALVLQDVLGVNLRHNQRHFGVHTEGAGVINNNGTGFHSVRSKFLGNATACEQSNINALEGVLGGLLHSICFAHKFNLLACAALGSQQTQFCKWEVSFFNKLQKFSTNSTGSA